MKDKKILLIGIMSVLLFGIVSFGIYKNVKQEPKDDKKPVSADAIKFKNEYESLNNTKRESDGATYSTMNIEENNPIKYVNAKEALEVMKKENAIIYVGANWCPWCRNAVPVLFDVAKKEQTKTIYYLNLDNDKSTFEIKDGKLVKTREGTKDYYALLEFLDKELNEYALKDSKGKEFKTGEKRIYMPFVVAVKDKEVVGSKTGTVSLDENQTKYDEMTKEQYQKVYKEYEALFKKAFAGNTCGEECD